MRCAKINVNFTPMYRILSAAVLLIVLALLGRPVDGKQKMKRCKEKGRPLIMKWTAHDLQSMVTWQPVKKWKNCNVTYKLESCIESCNDDGSWAERQCKVRQGGEHNMMCTTRLPPETYIHLRLRAKGACNRTRCSSTRSCSRNRDCEYNLVGENILEISTFSKPTITAKDVQPPKVNINIRLPAANRSMLCFFDSVYYKLSIIDVTELDDQSICETSPPSSELLDDPVTIEEHEVTPNDAVLCDDGQGEFEWKVEDLKPGRKYCVSGYYSLKKGAMAKKKSETGYYRFETKPDNTWMWRGIAAAVSIVTTAVILFIAYKINHIWKELFKYIHGDLPEPLKVLLDDLEKITSQSDSDHDSFSDAMHLLDEENLPPEQAERIYINREGNEQEGWKSESEESVASLNSERCDVVEVAYVAKRKSSSSCTKSQEYGMRNEETPFAFRLSPLSMMCAASGDYTAKPACSLEMKPTDMEGYSMDYIKRQNLSIGDHCSEYNVVLLEKRPNVAMPTDGRETESLRTGYQGKAMAPRISCNSNLPEYCKKLESAPETTRGKEGPVELAECLKRFAQRESVRPASHHVHCLTQVYSVK